MKTILPINYGQSHWQQHKPTYMISPKGNKIIYVPFIPAQTKMLMLGYKRITDFNSKLIEYKKKSLRKTKVFQHKCFKHNITIPKERKLDLWGWNKVTSETHQKYARNGIFIKTKSR